MSLPTSHKRTQEPTIEPVTRVELDDFLRGDGVLAANEADLLDSLIKTAREFIEEHTGRALITQTWTINMDRWPHIEQELGWWDGVREGAIGAGNSDKIELPKSPLQSVTSVSTFAADNTETVFDSANYYLDTMSSPGAIILNQGVVWPSFTRNRNGIKIVYVAGYGDSPTDVPSTLRTAIKMLAAHWYENREWVKTQSDQNQAPAPLHVTAMIKTYKVLKL